MKNKLSIPFFHNTAESLKYLFLASLAMVLLVEVSLSLRWPIGNDTGFLHYVAYLINEHGFLPYRDIFEINMPGTYLFHIAIGRFFGYSDFAFQMVNVVWLTVTLTVTWFIMKPFGRVVASASCLLFGLIYMGSGHHMILERDVIAILPIATALLLTIRCRPNQSLNLIYFLLGILFALASLIKPHMAIGLPAMIAYKCINDTNGPKSLKTLIKPFVTGGIVAMAGFLATLAIPFLWLWRIGALESFWELFSSYLPLYTQLYGDFQIEGTFPRIIFLIKLYRQFGGLGVLFMTSMFGVYIVLTNSMAATTKKRAILLLLLVGIYSIYAIIGGKDVTYHWMPYAYFACLCTAMILFYPPSFESLRRAILFPLFIFMVTVMMTVHLPHGAANTFQQLFYGRPVTMDEMDGRVHEIATYLNNNLSPADKVQPLDWIVGGAVPAMLASKAVVATPYITDFQFYHDVSNPYIQKLRKSFIAKLNKEKPKFIIDVYSYRQISGLGITYKFPELKAFITQHYDKDYTGNGFDIFRRNDD